ncbi:Uncharacterised protein [Streptococcus pneumoniae]|uniref:Uncharacterized protein n=1 Tax=Streptococcus pneumoniae TaxID=1313 RepID=A0AA87CD09_STREE|nr:Uncharacterised protein [Streptococcus pneumoniae]
MNDRYLVMTRLPRTRNSGCFFCLAPNGARQKNSHLIKKRTISKTKKFDIMRHVLN